MRPPALSGPGGPSGPGLVRPAPHSLHRPGPARLLYGASRSPAHREGRLPSGCPRAGPAAHWLAGARPTRSPPARRHRLAANQLELERRPKLRRIARAAPGDRECAAGPRCPAAGPGRSADRDTPRLYPHQWSEPARAGSCAGGRQPVVPVKSVC